MLDEFFLDDADALAASDRYGRRRGAAEAGARSRTALRNAEESGLADLRPDGKPRALLVAGPGPSADCVADLLAAVTGGSVPVSVVRPTGADTDAVRWALPGWAGPLDLLLLLTPDGTEPGLGALVEQAYRRGAAVVSVAPARSPLSGEVTAAHGLAVPFAAAPGGSSGTPASAAREPAAPGALWALLTPLLMLTDRLGLSRTPPEALAALADRLDEVAGRCGPAVPLYTNPAKTLAVELGETLPLLWSEGPVSGAAARHFGTVLAGLAGRPAVPAELPAALVSHAALLSGAFGAPDPLAAADDFFRDRAEEAPALRARVVLLRDGPPGRDSPAAAARELAHSRDAALSELQAADGSSVLEAAAELIGTADFAAVYLTLAPGGAG